ncbi:MAG: S8 family serine peptidase [Candidatus Marinimicrobia bacterium]|nr:S8 family serine peptidase [Candidatus Neomarinimicrobiota bacterium]MCF7839715.1 S8 family serine peptidase [Candidatus Neomarinimicrobiota bacterium]
MSYKRILSVTMLFFTLSIFAQPTQVEMRANKIFLKLSENVARNMALPKTTVQQLGVPAIDQVLADVSAQKVQPVYQVSATRGMENMYGMDRIFTVEFSGEIDISAVVVRLSDQPGIEYAEPVYKRQLFVTPNDSLFSVSWHHTKVRSEGAWDLTAGSDTIIIAIVDTGIDTTHPDLVENFWVNQGEIPGNSVDDDGNGYTDDILGWDFSGTESNPDEDNDPSHDWWWHPYHAEDHGSHVAGIAAATGNNSIGVIGMAYESKIMPLKVFPNSYDDVIVDAIMYAADNGADVINCSWGGGMNSSTINDAILYARNTKGCIVIAAAGNDASSFPFYPANSPGVVSVGATTGNDSRAVFSNYGSWVDMCAPGAGIWSTTDPANPFHENLYEAWDGTSMAAPMVSGVAALIRSQFPNLSVDEQEEQLIDGDDIGNVQMGLRLNAFKAVLPFRITHTPIIEYDADEDILVSADILDPGQTLYQVRAYYSVDNEAFEFVELTDLSGEHWEGNIPAQSPGTVMQYYVEATDSAGHTVYAPSDGPDNPYMFLVGGMNSFITLVNDYVETPGNWLMGVAEDNATAGLWEWGNPNGTWQNSTPVQPEDDHTEAGENCFFTGNAPASSTNNGEADVDGGRTTLRSSFYNFPEGSMPILTYWRWYTNAEGLSPGFDFWRVQARSHEDSVWVILEETTESESAWVLKTFYLPQFLTDFSQLQVQFIAEDLGGGSLVEAAVDDIRIITGNLDFFTPGDVNYDSLINIQDIVMIVSHIMGSVPLTGNAALAADYNQDGDVNVMDLVSLVNVIIGT